MNCLLKCQNSPGPRLEAIMLPSPFFKFWQTQIYSQAKKNADASLNKAPLNAIKNALRILNVNSIPQVLNTFFKLENAHFFESFLKSVCIILNSAVVINL